MEVKNAGKVFRETVRLMGEIWRKEWWVIGEA
jgi:hypothetical protein